MKDRCILSFDPSLTSTGYAVFSRGRLVTAGFVGRMTATQIKRSAMLNRLSFLVNDVRGLIQDCMPETVIIETPAPQGPKLGAAGQAKYGMAVGVVIGAALSLRSIHDIILTRADEWTHRVSKKNRQLAVAAKYPEYDPAKDKGGDISDAIGLIDWWRIEQQGVCDG